MNMPTNDAATADEPLIAKSVVEAVRNHLPNLTKLAKRYNIESVTLVGSVARKEFPKSDIDIVIVQKGNDAHIESVKPFVKVLGDTISEALEEHGLAVREAIIYRGGGYGRMTTAVQRIQLNNPSVTERRRSRRRIELPLSVHLLSEGQLEHLTRRANVVVEMWKTEEVPLIGRRL